LENVTVVMPSNAESVKLPDPSLYLYWNLESERMFYIDAEIDESILDIQREILMINMRDKDIPVEQRKPIKIFIDSPGGMVAESMSICETIMLSKTPVYTIDVANAYSGAALIFISGHKRFIMKYADVLLHSGSASQDGSFDAIQESNKNYQKIVGKMWQLVRDRTGIDDKLIKKNKSKEWYITSEEAVKLGIADKILESFDEVM